ncbi:MAG: molybdopterin-dependent oxidoreductase [Polyangiaceae bacterium]
MSEWKPTACILCECNCGLEVELGGEGGRHLVRLRGDRAHPASQGYACEKAHRLDRYQHARDRLTRPLRRRSDGSFEAVDWDTAIREVAERLAKIRDQHGGPSIFYYGGGGQANHLPGAYATATRAALGSRYRSNALAQEKTGEIWVCQRMLGAATRADFEHAEVALFLGKNPWHSHSIPRARVTLRAIARDPSRTLIVVDPRRSETAELADIHLALRPGTDAWLLTALLRALVDEGLVDQAFIEQHTKGFAEVREVLGRFDFQALLGPTGLDPELVRRTARRIAAARSFASFEDLGVQMNQNSTLVSYLHRLLIFVTGSFGKAGSHFVPTPLVPFASGKATERKSPVVGARIVSGLVPCNRIADEILSDHPARYRAMWIEAANPAHSLADSRRMKEALAALDLVVVVDVARTETAELAHYVLPVPTQFEKAEASFFNFEFPKNHFQLRSRLFAAPPGVLPEAEIHARLAEALGAIGPADIEPLRAAARRGRLALGEALLERVLPDPRLSSQIAVLLYRGLELPPEKQEGAVLFGLALRAVMERGASLARAGFEGSPLEVADRLFQAMLDGARGMTFSVDSWDEVLGRVGTDDGKIALELPDLLTELESALRSPPERDTEFPFVLSAGERRSFTANTLLRDPAWRDKDPEGALRIHPDDAARLALEPDDSVRITTRGGSAVARVAISDTMQVGHVSLPNGFGTRYPGDDGTEARGVAPNELTRTSDCDPFVGTPWHKCVAARLERVPASQR